MKKIRITIACSIIMISCFALYSCASTNNNNGDYISPYSDSNSSQLDSSSNDYQTQDQTSSSEDYQTQDQTSSSDDTTTQDNIGAESETVEDNEKSTCWALAEDVVKSNLKSPSTAKFPFSYSDDGVSFSKANGIYTVTGWVDAENSYGAKLRNNFTVTMTKSGSGDDEKFTAESCNID